MPTVHETVYPRLKSAPTRRELVDLYTPTEGELELAERSSKGEPARLAFLYEHPQWFTNIFTELERRRVPFDKIFIPDHFFDVGAPRPPFKVLFNRMSPSADSRRHGSGIFHSLAYLEHLEKQGTGVVNGAQSFRYEISKASQAALLKSLNFTLPTVRDITANAKKFKFRELDAAQFPHSLPDLDAALINTNYALQARLQCDSPRITDGQPVRPRHRRTRPRQGQAGVQDARCGLSKR